MLYDFKFIFNHKDIHDSIHGQIMPDRIFNNNKEQFFKNISDKIVAAREKIKNEKA